MSESTDQRGDSAIKDEARDYVLTLQSLAAMERSLGGSTYWAGAADALRHVLNPTDRALDSAMLAMTRDALNVAMQRSPDSEIRAKGERNARALSAVRDPLPEGGS